jgi:hypothetical protein
MGTGGVWRREYTLDLEAAAGVVRPCKSGDWPIREMEDRATIWGWEEDWVSRTMANKTSLTNPRRLSTTRI